MPSKPVRTADQYDTHIAVVEVYDALRAAIFVAVPTPQNPTGKETPDEALRRLSRLGRALRAFPDRRVYPDPFVRAEGLVMLNFPGTDTSAVTGTSVHDAVVRLAGQVYDQLGVIDLVPYTDPATGEARRGAVYEHGYEYEDAAAVGDGTDRVKVVCPGPPRVKHFSELAWSTDLWDRLYEAHASGLHRFYLFSAFAPHPGWLRVALEHEAARSGVYPPSGPAEDPPEVLLSDDDAKVLDVLDRSRPRLLDLANISTIADLSRKTAGACVAGLIDRHLAIRPDGPRSGATITDLGRRAIAAFRAAGPEAA